MEKEYISIPLETFTDLVRESAAFRALCTYLDNDNCFEDGTRKKAGCGTFSLEVLHAFEESLYG